MNTLKTHKKIFFLLLFSLLLSACATEATPMPTVFQPSATPTLIPLDEIDLKQQILVPSNEMPEGYLATKTKDSLPNLDVPEPLKLIWQQLETNTDVAGGVRIYLYESKLDVKDAYIKEVESNLSLSKSNKEITNLGEMATLSSYQLHEDTITDLVFARCYVTTTIRMINIPSEDVIIGYAQKLDNNIVKYICR